MGERQFALQYHALCGDEQILDRGGSAMAQCRTNMTNRSARTRVAAKLAAGFAIATVAMLMIPHPAGATISGPCQGTGYNSPDKPASAKAAAQSGGSSVDFKTATQWNVKSTDYLSGVGSADGAMSSGQAQVDLFGIPVQVAGGSGSGDSGSGGPLRIADLSSKLPGPLQGLPITRSVTLSGSAVPDPNGKPPASAPCSGMVQIVFTDVNPVGTVAGAGSLGLTAAGLITIIVNLLRGFAAGAAGAAGGKP